MTLLIQSEELAGLISVEDAIGAVRAGFTDQWTRAFLQRTEPRTFSRERVKHFSIQRVGAR